MSSLNVRRLGYAMGARIDGLDLTRPIDDATVAAIRQVWLDNVVICIPGQNLTPDQLLGFCARFGEPNRHPMKSQQLPDNPSVVVIVNQPTTIKSKAYEGGVADEWHTDQEYTTTPPSASLLNAQVVPDVGGDTMFANMYLGYESLSPAYKAMIERLDAVHDVTVGDYYTRYTPEKQASVRAENPPVVHPIVRVHPETGRKALYLGSRVRNIVGMTEEESKPLIKYLTAHSTRYEFTYPHRWTQYDLLMWDNRCAMHCAVANYDLRQLRRMIRCELSAPQSGRLLVEKPVLA